MLIDPSSLPRVSSSNNFIKFVKIKIGNKHADKTCRDEIIISGYKLILIVNRVLLFYLELYYNRLLFYSERSILDSNPHIKIVGSDNEKNFNR